MATTSGVTSVTISNNLAPKVAITWKTANGGVVGSVPQFSTTSASFPVTMYVSFPQAQLSADVILLKATGTDGIVTLRYAGCYSYMTYGAVTATVTGTVLAVAFTVPPVLLTAMIGNPPVGYGNNIAGGCSRRNGVYENSTSALVPGVPFYIMDATRKSQLVSASNKFTWSSGDVPAASFTLDDSGFLMGYVAKASGPVVPSGNTLVKSDGAPAGSWGVFLNYGDGLPRNVALVYQDSTGAVNAFGPNGLVPVSLFDPVGFANIGANACVLRLPDGCAARAAGTVNCWAFARAGCTSGADVCTLNGTDAGFRLCASECAMSAAAEEKARAVFIDTVCAEEGYTSCAPVAGVAITPCTGWKSTAFGAACTLACAGTPGKCDRAKKAFCAARPDDPQCACLNVLTNPLKVPEQGGYSFAEFMCQLQGEYGVSNTSNLVPECWWPTCRLQDGALVTTDAVNHEFCNSYAGCVTILENVDKDIKRNITDKCTAPGGPLPACATRQQLVAIGGSANNAKTWGPAPITGLVLASVLFVVLILTVVLVCYEQKMRRAP